MSVGTTALRHRAGHGGFTLIEVLVAVAVMLAVVSLLVELFTSANDMSGRGTGRAMADNEARVAMQMLSADLREALADPLLNLRVALDDLTNDTYGVESSELYVVTLNADPGTGRAARVVGYEVRASPHDTNRYDLWRGVAEIPFDAAVGATGVYDDSRDLRASLLGARWAAVARDVALFRVGTCDTGGTMRTKCDAVDGDGWPLYVDVYLELLEERDATKAADMITHGAPDTVWKARLDEWVRRYSSRIHFDNRNGYRDR